MEVGTTSRVGGCVTIFNLVPKEFAKLPREYEVDRN